MSTLMIQGTTSDAGKSALAAALCRLLYRRSVAVAPFKPQNMALNSAVTVDGGEIGRAQAVQAQACGIEPHTDMNPVLLKPNGNTGAQVIVNGHAVADMDARRYHAYKPQIMLPILEAHRRLLKRYQIVIAEGAGSPAEINLREGDVANMGFAEQVDCPVILIADIDRGGVFAHLVGTLELLSENERKRVIGFVINRFRGDVNILQPGIEWLQQRTQVPVLAVLPYVEDLHIEAEDGLSAKFVRPQATDKFRVVVPHLPRISNRTDLDPLLLNPRVSLHFVCGDEPIPSADLLVLPGSKSTRSDLQWLRQQGWPQYIDRHLRYGGKVIGVCGGLQMLGKAIHDPHGSEGVAGSEAGLGYLDCDTTLLPKAAKKLRRVEGELQLSGGIECSGYEIHSGETRGSACDHPAIKLSGRNDGAISADGVILGTYFHGVFEQQAACEALLKWAGMAQAEAIDYHRVREQHIDRWADVVDQHLDVDKLVAQLLNNMPFAAPHFGPVGVDNLRN